MQEIFIGVDNSNYLKFDDGEVLGSYPFPHIISRIDVEFNQSHVIGINVTYKVGNGQQVSGQSSIKFKNTPAYTKTFIVPEGDFLQEINGCFENVINSIGFVTYKGYKEIFGNPIGVSFRHFSPQNTFTAAKGSFDKWLNFIAFRVVPLPPYAMQQFYPTQNPQMNQVPLQQPPQQQMNQVPLQQPPQQQMPQVPPQQPLQQQMPPQQYPYPPSNSYPQQQQQYTSPPPPPTQQGYVPPPPPPTQQGYVPPPPPAQQPYTPYPPPQYPQYPGYPNQQPYPYPNYQPYPPPQNTTTIVEVIDTNPYGGGYNQGYNNYYNNQRPGMGVGAAMGLGMLTGMAVSDLTHHHHGGIYDVNVYGHRHHHHHRY
ncbi:unnamed protein product [Paramecium sonneborni]|uniref:Jacalin-type lectin domain-containing protein n=1 Tax=Paramecium sonneborni TaxID=65129 RepID=A0A8S1KFF6_9CILI|nr:unnamed protein product [Paramecium sonneborni]